MLELQSIPHVGENIFGHLDTPVLLKCRSVSTVWKEIAEDALVKRWKDHPFLAIENNEVGVIKLLLEHPKCVEINWNVTRYYDIAEITPLMLACRNGLFKVVELFLDHSVTRNIDLNMKHTLGDPTKENISAFDGHRIFVSQIRMNPNNASQMILRTYGMYTAFSYACHFGHKDVVELMLNNADTRGIDLKSTNKDGETILSLACRQEQTDVVKLLLRHSVTENMNLDVSGAQKGPFCEIMTVFMWACKNGHTDIVQMLLEHYSQHVRQKVLPAFHLACKYGHKDVVKLLACSYGHKGVV